MPKSADEVYKKAVELWGKDLQLSMVIEEASELIKGICKLKRNGFSIGAVSNAAEEIADMEIMIEQLKIILNCRDAVDVWRDYKIHRLKETIEKVEVRNGETADPI